VEQLDLSQNNLMLLYADGEPEPFYTCKHCGKKVWFLVHGGRSWKCKDCFFEEVKQSGT